VTTRSIDELKTVYVAVVNGILSDELDALTSTTNALLNNTQDAKPKYESLSLKCSERLMKAMSQEEFKLLQPHLVELTADITGLVLSRLQNK